MILGITEMKNFKHVIEIDEKSNKLRIFRHFEDGAQDLYTETELPDISAHDEWGKFEEFARQLGENLLMDSPAARRLLSL